MKVYSHDLRERLLVACLLPQVRSVATQFQPSVSLLCKLLQRRSGSVAVLLRHGRAATRLVADGYERLWSCLVAQPDAMLDELWPATGRLRWSRPAPGLVPKRAVSAGLGPQKKPVRRV